VPALNVNPDEFVKSIGETALKVIVLAPKLIDLVFELVDNKALALKLYPFVLKEPAVKVNAETIAKLPARFNSMFGLLNVTIEAAFTPLFVNVTVPLPEFESKVTLSAPVGGKNPAEPPDPPDVDAQFNALTESQFPAPPTQ